MWIINGILAGLIAGAFMGLSSQIGYFLGIIKSHLVIIDGEFFLRKLKIGTAKPAVYAAGIAIHLATSIIFGVIYFLLSEIISFESRSLWAVIPYVLILWLAMLLSALPVAGQGLFGKKAGRFAWLEQLVLHVIFGAGLWWASGIL
jgi:hypothetical protein